MRIIFAEGGCLRIKVNCPILTELEITICDFQFSQDVLEKKSYVFTELGVAMLSSVLNSKIAIQINISIMRAFVAVRQSLTHIQLNSIENRVVSLERDIMLFVFVYVNEGGEDEQYEAGYVA